MAAVVLAALLPVPCALAAGDGIATRGATGGLTIPSGSVLQHGDAAFTASDFQEPALGSNTRRRDLTFGIGLAPNFELFGRYANYENPIPGSTAANGLRDISANVKLKLPRLWRHQPDLAIGVTDLGGGATNFGSTYFVASDRLGWLDWTLGYARAGALLREARNPKTFDGVFGGLQLRAGESGLSAIAEYDGQQKFAGVRYRSPSIQYLAGTRLELSVLRSFGARDPAGRDVDRTSAAVSVIVPLEQIAERPRTFRPERALRAADSQSSAMGATPEDRLEALQRALVASGMERVRVGTLDRDLVVEYENHVFGQTEADALGVVLGLAAELAPAGTSRLRAVTLKAGLPMYVTSAGVAEYRSFLRSADSGSVSGSLAVDGFKAHQAERVSWQAALPGRRNFAHFQLEPELVNTVATELAVFDYSLAANLKSFFPLWRGAEFHTSYVQRLSSTENFEPGNFFGAFRHRNGLKVAALQQSFWLGSHVLVSAGVGRYRYDNFGVEVESTMFMPGGRDVIRLKGATYERNPGESRAQAMPLSASYRWAPAPHTWVEAGLQQYTDGTRGPSIVLTRWFGEVGANLFVRRGGTRTFGGFELTIPLTPRRGADLAGFTLNGTPQFTKGVRTRIVSGSGVNFVELGGVLDFPLQYNAEQRLLNGGHVSEKYFISRLHRMREAFYLYARDRLPE
ncbi:YjbH domain-containing protein [Ramlibacter albus]|uniref:YjbH domain-containing protein n=1 Tax=Ramlibacter albus TaxID=2079448 RepID=A0A923M9G2_9BURK|nr:YjbH domain-containing protein [Ramlibacter albus]